MTNNRNKFTVKPWNELHFNPIYDDNDPLQQRPFLSSVNLNKDQQYDNDSNNIQLTKTSSDGRNKHYKYNGSAAEAITAALEAEGRLL